MFSGEVTIEGLQRHLRREVGYGYFQFGSRDAGEQRLYLDTTNQDVAAIR